MKTSSKILLAGALTLVAIMASFAIYVKASVMPEASPLFSNNNVIHATGDYSEEIRDISGFNAIHAGEGIQVYVTQADEFYVKVVAREDILGHIITEVQNGTLKIKHKPGFRIRKAGKQEVFIEMPEITGLQSSSGAGVYSKDILKGQAIELGVSSGALLKAHIDYKQVDASSSSGAEMTIKGYCKEGEFDASSGAQINASELNVDEVHAEASSGASIKLGQVKAFSANASSGGAIKYKGEPVLREINLSSGGSAKPYE